MAPADYRKLLKQNYIARVQRNRHYSLRAFARDLQILPSRLSDVLNGKQGLSAEVAQRLAARLGLSSKETLLFVTSVESCHARNRSKKESAARQLKALAEQEAFKTIQADVFAAVSDWYHFTLVELTSIDGVETSVEALARMVGLPIAVVDEAIERLLKVGLLQRNGERLEPSMQFYSTTQDIPSQAIRRHHEQILTKAIEALHLHPVQEREFSTNTFAIDPDDLPKMKSEIVRFRRRLEARYKTSRSKKDVFVFSTQLFSLLARDR